MPSVLTVRGDLRSQTGYSKALRAILKLMQPHFDQVYGVDLHYSTTKSVENFPHHILGEDELHNLTSRSTGDLFTVLHFTTPDHFRPIHNACNIGYFFWETDRFRPEFFWEHNIRLMDVMWLPNEFVARVVKQSGFSGPCQVIPWPHDFDLVPEEECTDIGLEVECAYCPKEGSLQLLAQPLGKIRDAFDRVYFSVLTDAPRKGLPILISEWCEYIKTRRKRSFLLLKVSSINVTKSASALSVELLATLSRFARNATGDMDIGFLFGALTDSAMNRLYRITDAYVTTTLGEGFGGPIVECLQQRRPFISPRHTSLQDLVAPDYPYILQTESTVLDLGGFLPVYSPSSTWHVTVKRALVQRLLQIDQTSASDLEQVVKLARAHAEDVCGIKRVTTLLSSACRQLEAISANKPNEVPLSISRRRTPYPRGIQPTLS